MGHRTPGRKFEKFNSVRHAKIRSVTSLQAGINTGINTNAERQKRTIFAKAGDTLHYGKKIHQMTKILTAIWKP